MVNNANDTYKIKSNLGWQHNKNFAHKIVNSKLSYQK